MPKITTGADVFAALQSKQTNPTCPSCGKNNWAAQGEDGHAVEVLVPLLQPQGFQIPPPGIPAITVVCMNCGYIRFYAKMILEGPLAPGGSNG